jgi:hypothetical protein
MPLLGRTLATIKRWIRAPTGTIRTRCRRIGASRKISGHTGCRRNRLAMELSKFFYKSHFHATLRLMNPAKVASTKMMER